MGHAYGKRKYPTVVELSGDVEPRVPVDADAERHTSDVISGLVDDVRLLEAAQIEERRDVMLRTGTGRQPHQQPETSQHRHTRYRHRCNVRSEVL